MEVPERAHAAIAFTSVINYAELAQTHKEQGAHLLATFRDTLNPLLEEYGGKYVGKNPELDSRSEAAKAKERGLKGWLSGVERAGEALSAGAARPEDFVFEFENCLDAVSFAIALQQKLKIYNSEVSRQNEILLRIGIHLGAVEHRGEELHGEAISVASRIEPLAGPEGICLTQRVYDEIQDNLDVRTAKLRNEELRELKVPHNVYRILVPEPGEIVEEAAVRAPNNLPTQAPLIGRNDVIESAWPLLLRSNVRVLTLTGPGGVGKTAASIEIARSLIESFPNGVYFVSLASITDAEYVLPAVATVLEVKEQPNTPLIETLKIYFGQRKVLLLLDNFEQIASSSAHFLTVLSDSCPKLKFLVTSRKPLRIHGEQEFAMPSLPVPSLKILPSIGEMSENPSIALFMERTHAIKPDFEITDENSRDIAEICVRVDGLPLALELAAARMKILPAHMILTRLGSRLGLLTGGARDLAARQQTLRNTIAWSHDLLNESEKKLFRRLAVFVGGFTLEAAENVCLIENDLNVMDDITALLDNSLLKRIEETKPEGGKSSVESEYRFGFLETIREFASECLKKSSESDTIEKARTDFFTMLAEKAEPKLNGPEAILWLERLELEHDNMRAGLRWSIDRKETATSLRLAGALGLFWEYHNHLKEGSQFLDAVTKISPLESSISTAKVLSKEGILAVYRADYRRAIDLLREAYSMSLRIGDRNGMAQSMRGLAFAANSQGEFSKASALYEESGNLFRELKDSVGIAFSLKGLSWSLRNLGDTATAKSLLNESTEIFRKLGDKYNLATCLNLQGQTGIKTDDYNVCRVLLMESLAIGELIHDNGMIGISQMSLGELERLHGNDVEAISFYKKGVVIFEEYGQRSLLAWSYHNMAHSMIHLKQYSEATKYFARAVSLFRELKETAGLAHCLAGLGGIALAEGSPDRAARLFGATEAIVEKTRTSLDPVDLIEFERNLSSTRTQLGSEKFSAETTVGRGLTLEQAVAYGLKR